MRQLQGELRVALIKITYGIAHSREEPVLQRPIGGAPITVNGERLKRGGPDAPFDGGADYEGAEPKGEFTQPYFGGFVSERIIRCGAEADPSADRLPLHPCDYKFWAALHGEDHLRESHEEFLSVGGGLEISE